LSSVSIGSPRAASLTDEGRHSHAQVAPLLAGLEEAASEATAAAHAVRCRLKVNADPWFVRSKRRTPTRVSSLATARLTLKQTQRGRPGPDTAYRKITKRRFDIQWTTDEEAIAYDHNSDGMYPLITNDRSLSPAQVLEAHKANR
jgi:hypothetical protein